MNSANHSERRALLTYRSVDLLTAVMIGVAFGVLFWGWDRVFSILSGTALLSYPPSTAAVAGVWLIAGVVGGLVVRKPGAALLTEMVAASVELLLGNQWGFGVLPSGIIQGLGVELALALFVYRRNGPAVAALGGAIAGAAEAVYEWWAYIPLWSWTDKISYLVFFSASGAVIAGLGGWALVEALRKAGALDAFDDDRAVRDRV